MLDLEQIKTQYDSSLHKFDRGLLREYLQYQILSIIFGHKNGAKLSFLGGTALRIVYGLKRFLEDLDFDNNGLSFSEFQKLGKYVENHLEKSGFEVEVKFIRKLAFHCNIKFPQLLYEQGLSPLKSEKILIQIDTFDQGVDYEPEIFILDKFELFDQIRVTPKEVILAQKLWTVIQRKRFKGRDFYDIMILLQNTKPDEAFLEAKFGTKNLSKVRKSIIEAVADVDFEKLSLDVAKMLIDKNEASNLKVFIDFIEQKLS